MKLPRNSIAVTIVALVCAMLTLGCAQLQVPQIDPSGRNVFLPSNQSTTVNFGGVQPAFQTPADPPDCPDPPPPVPGQVGVTPQAAPPATIPPAGGRLLQPNFNAAAPVTNPASIRLTPKQMVAPVGTEVVLVAGLCGGDGYLRTRQTLEWVLTQNSVGYITEVGDSGETFLPWLFQSGSRKISNSQAIGRTSVRAAQISRGTPTPNDDVLIREGQNFIGVTSPVEGTTYIGVSARDVANWDGVRPVSAIYWVNAQWALPSPAIVPAGHKLSLTTTITRPNTGQPVPGWIVRYEIAGGAGAGFGPEFAQGAEATTNELGQAVVEISQREPAAGVTQVRIAIVKPGQQAGDPPGLVLGQGSTNISWSAAGLSIQASGPPLADVGGEVTYNVTVTNTGDLPASGVVVSDVLPPELTVVASNPPHQTFGAENRWDLGELPGGASQSIVVRCRTQQRGEVNYCFHAKSNETPQRNSCVTTRIWSPTMTVNLINPADVKVGETAQFRIEIVNTGQETVRDVNLQSVFGEGLRHSENFASPLRWPVGEIPAGQTVRKALSFEALAGGRQCHQLIVTAGDGQQIVREGCVNVEQPPAPPTPEPAPQNPDLAVRVTGPLERQTSEVGDYVFQVANTGDTLLTNVRIVVEFSGSLSPVLASSDRERLTTNAVRFTVPSLPVGQTAQRQLNCQALRTDPSAIVRATVGCDQRVSRVEQTTTRIVPKPEPAPSPTPMPDPTPDPGPTPAVGDPRSNTLQISIADRDDPVKVGEAATYFIIIKNDRDAPDQNVTLSITLPDGVTFESITGPALFQRLQDGGKTVLVTPIREMRVGESANPFKLTVKANKAGMFKMIARATSGLVPGGVTAETETTALME